MKIVLDNIVFSLQQAGGISRYWFELARRFARSGEQVSFIEQANNGRNIFRSKLDFGRCHVIAQNRIPTPIARYLPVYAKVETPAVFHSSYFRTCRRSGVFNIVTLYDFIYERFDTGLRKHVHMLQKQYAIQHADGIICISKNTENDLHEFYPEAEHVQTKVIYIGAGESFYPLDKTAIDTNAYAGILKQKYALFVGRRSEYKNFQTAVDAVSRMDNHWLVVAGGEALGSYEERLLQTKLGGRYFFIKAPSDSELNIFYNFAVCMLYPSSYEGFGIPVAEAMKAGCPVVTTSAASLPEVAGNAGLMIENIDSTEIVDTITLLENTSFRNRIVNLGLEQAKKFSWDTCFKETIAFYKQVTGSRH